MPRHRLGVPRAILGLYLALLVTACKKDATGTLGQVQVTLTATTLTLMAGGTANTTVTVVRPGGFHGAVRVSAEGAPEGVTIAPLTLGEGQSTGTLTFQSAANAAVATAVVTLRATGNNVDPGTATLSLTVQQPPPPGSFTLSLGSASLSIAQGASANITVNINRTNLPGPVTVTVTGQPAGMDVTVNPASTTGSQTTISVTAGVSLATVLSTLTVRGNATGAPEQTASLPVTVTALGSIALSLANTAVSLAQGALSSQLLTVTRTNYTGPVTLSSDGPAGLGVVFSPSSLSGTATTATLSLSAIATMLPGIYPVTIRASGVGITERTIALDVTVLGLAPSFTLGSLPGCLSLVGPGSFASSLRINRTNFSGPVTLTVTGQPSGMNVTLSPESTAGDVQMMIVLGGVATGDYALTLHGNAAGMPEQTASFRASAMQSGTLGTVQIALSPSALTVPAGGGGNTTVTVTRPTGSYCSPIQVSALGAPTGVTIAPLTIPIGQTVGTLSLQTAPTTLIGTTPLTIRATSSTSSSNVTILPGTATLPLTVQLPLQER